MTAYTKSLSLSMLLQRVFEKHQLELAKKNAS